MDDVVAFLRARLAEEQADAEAATAAPWTVEPTGLGLATVAPIPTTFGDDRMLIKDARHIARQDPAATLARCDALTALVDLHKPEPGRRVTYDASITPTVATVTICAGCGGDNDQGDVWGEWPCETLRHVAAIWRGHDDFNADWSH